MITDEELIVVSNKNFLEIQPYFSSIVCPIEQPEFLDAVRKVSAEKLQEARKTQRKNELYPVFMTDNLYDIPEILPFQHYVGQSAYSILIEYGYDLTGYEVYFSELWCQEHYKHSGMEQHVHGFGSQLVGFYFLDCPKDCSRVVFHDPRPGKVQNNFKQKDTERLTLSSNEINFQPKNGLLMFADAFLPHSFTRHGSDKPMRFIHFNIGLRPSMVFNTPPAAEIV